jgi:hypothetical protein
MTTTDPSPPSAPEAGELARRLRQGIKQENGDRRFPTIIVTIKDAEQIIALLLKLAETEKQLAEVQLILTDRYKSDQVRVFEAKHVIAPALRSAATSGKGE